MEVWVAAATACEGIEVLLCGYTVGVCGLPTRGWLDSRQQTAQRPSETTKTEDGNEVILWKHWLTFSSGWQWFRWSTPVKQMKLWKTWKMIFLLLENQEKWSDVLEVILENLGENYKQYIIFPNFPWQENGSIIFQLFQDTWEASFRKSGNISENRSTYPGKAWMAEVFWATTHFQSQSSRIFQNVWLKSFPIAEIIFKTYRKSVSVFPNCPG